MNGDGAQSNSHGDESLIPGVHRGTAFDHLPDYLALPRISGLVASSDAERIVIERAALSADGARFIPQLWSLQLDGPPRQLTFDEAGARLGAVASNGDVLFLSPRSMPGADPGAPNPVALWRLPADGGEAAPVLALPGDITAVKAATAANTVVVAAKSYGGTAEQDAELRALRRAHKVSATLHSGYPVKYWDHDLGSERVDLFVVADGVATRLLRDSAAGIGDPDFDLSADGSFIVAAVSVPEPIAAHRTRLERVEVRTGRRTVLRDVPGFDFFGPVISPDEASVAAVWERFGDAAQAPARGIEIAGSAAGGAGNDPAGEIGDELELWPSGLAWSGSSRLIVTADEHGRAPMFVLRTGERTLTRLTADDVAHTAVAPTDAGVLALRSSVGVPPHPVRVDLASGIATNLAAPDRLPEVPGTLTELTATADDGTPLRAWLALPHGASDHEPAPPVLWIHGGPLSSWNSWSWRWNPWLLVAQGYAVVLPDPALSTGYGRPFIQRGWGRWGGAPFTDLMAMMDAATALPEVDADRTAAMGGSFGGYMANWVAGHTQRFDAVVTHAGLWALDQFVPTTDLASYWAREVTPEMAVENSPHLYVADIATPMLVIHGEDDDRVPVGEALRLWYELLSESGLPAADDGSSEHRLLLFPDEGHWILKPQHARIWYETVLNFLAVQLHGEDEAVSPELGIAEGPEVAAGE